MELLLFVTLGGNGFWGTLSVDDVRLTFRQAPFAAGGM